jgi:polyisoprenoid-binding protein YceI
LWWVAGGNSTPSAPISAATLSAEDAGGERVVFHINPELSEVRFVISEELFGSPKTVIGATDQVAGEIAVDMANAANSHVGQIRINARTLETDDENRNRSLRNLILESSNDEFEFVTFAPSALNGLPAEAVAVGDTVEFEIMGDLTVRHITTPVTFTATATLVAEDRLEGTATTVVTRDTYEITIPSAPGVANVGNEVTLEISFVAVPAAEDGA